MALYAKKAPTRATTPKRAALTPMDAAPLVPDGLVPVSEVVGFKTVGVLEPLGLSAVMVLPEAVERPDGSEEEETTAVLMVNSSD